VEKLVVCRGDVADNRKLSVETRKGRYVKTKEMGGTRKRMTNL
jgi:hypothetical protein